MLMLRTWKPSVDSISPVSHYIQVWWSRRIPSGILELNPTDLMGSFQKKIINITSAATIFQLHTNTTKIAHPSSKYHFYPKAQRLVFLPQDAKFKKINK
jgi:hypothetical protein